MEQVSHDEPVGNTKSTDSDTPKHAGNQYYRWQFTLRAYYHEPNDPINVDHKTTPEELAEALRFFCKEFYFQLEEGEDGYIHYQGCFSLIIKHRLSEVKNICGWNYIHLEPAWNWHALKKYCSKFATRIDGPWNHDTNWVRTIEVYHFTQWMWDIYDIIIKPCEDYRTIYWFWEPIGNCGKSSFAKWLTVMLGATYLDGGSGKDIAFSLPNNPKIIVFDFPRSMEDRVPYGAIERCKNGMVFSPKYESRVKLFNSPHIICFANFPPDESDMSADRWHIINLNIYKTLYINES